ncbi:MAG TPA: DUF488 family protein [Steroidobacteraceae bacterium]|nr:DUF488 family protein [Steroidobacteraceae bacterium]
MSLAVVRLGRPRARSEGVRLGTVRRPPRGVPKREFARRDYYDVWIPELAPSVALMRSVKRDDPRWWPRFARRYRAEMRAPAPTHLLDLLAALSHHANFAIGCYCADARRCHRSVLRELLTERGAKLRRT